MNRRAFYERYHQKTSLQKRIVDINHFTYKFVINIILKFMRGNKVLDIGCGAGTLDLFLADRGISVLGIDISNKAVRTAEENAKFLDLQKLAKFRVLDFPKDLPNGKFDFIICSEVLEHLKDDGLAVKQIKNLLKDKGRVLVTTPSTNSVWNKLRFTKRHDETAGHVRRYTHGELEKLFVNEKLKVIYKGEQEGALREAMFVFPIFGFIIRIANKFRFVSNTIIFLDNIFLTIFGGSSLYIVGQKNKDESSN